MTLINKYDWFTPIKDVMSRFVPTDAKRILEIGSFEGLSARFFMERCPKATMVCIDHFLGGADQTGLDIEGLLQRFKHNTAEYEGMIEVLNGNSWEELRYVDSEEFDVVFVDGSHLCWDVLNDLCQAYRVCKKGGIIIADDYTWENQRPDCPKVAIDAFLSVFKGKVELVHIERVAMMKKL